LQQAQLSKVVESPSVENHQESLDAIQSECFLHKEEGAISESANMSTESNTESTNNNTEANNSNLQNSSANKVKFLIGFDSINTDQQSGQSTPNGGASHNANNTSSDRMKSNDSSESPSPPELNRSLNQDGLSELLIRSNSANDASNTHAKINEFQR
jgi:hypothetical protein